MTRRSRFTRPLAVATLAAAAIVTFSARTATLNGQAPAKGVPPVAVTSLRPLLPTVDGWTKGQSAGDRIVLSDTCAYAYADTIYTNGEMEVRVTLADTGKAEDSLISLATMIVSFPDGYTDEIPPATTIKRIDYNGSPAAERWDAAKNEGEFTVLIGGRFVAKAEGKRVDALETLRAFIARVDLKALADLK